MNELATQPVPAFRPMAARFRGFLPVVVDVETGGFDWNRHALLEIAVAPIDLDAEGRYIVGEGASAHLEPAPGTEIDPKSLEITGIVLDHPFRLAKPERQALDHVFANIRAAIHKHNCQRAILVGHNAHFDPTSSTPPSRAPRTSAALPPLQRVRHRDPGRRRLRPDRASHARYRPRPGMEHARTAHSRCTTANARRSVLRDCQRLVAGGALARGTLSHKARGIYVGFRCLTASNNATPAARKH